MRPGSSLGDGAWVLSIDWSCAGESIRQIALGYESRTSARGWGPPGGPRQPRHTHQPGDAAGGCPSPPKVCASLLARTKRGARLQVKPVRRRAATDESTTSHRTKQGARRPKPATRRGRGHRAMAPASRPGRPPLLDQSICPDQQISSRPRSADPPFRRRCSCVRCWGSSDSAHPIHGPVVRALPPCGASDGLVPSGSIRFGRGRAPGLGFLVKHRRSVQADPAPLDHHTSSLLCASRTTPSNPSQHPHVSVTTVTPHQHTVDNHRSNRFTCTHNRSTAALD